MRAACIVLVWLIACLAPASLRAGMPEARSEDAVKAAFLFRFAGYVDWPATEPSSGEFVIGVMGAEGVLSALQFILRNHPLNGLPARARLVTGASALRDLRILYIGENEEDRIKSTAAAVGNRPILIVTSSNQGLENGGTINFLAVDRHLRFEVSLAAAERSGLKISSDLLSVAVRVEGGRIRSGVPCAAPGRGVAPTVPCPAPAVLALHAPDPGDP